MSKRLIEIKNLNNELFVYWVITDFCNQHCSYCADNLNDGTYATGIKPGFPTDDEIDQFIDKLIDISLSTGKRLRVCISGGEPTVHPKLPDIITRIKQHGIVTIITNGTRSARWWRDLPTLPDSVIISLHPEYYDNKKIRINDTSTYLVDSGVNLQYNLMCLPNYWTTVLSIVSDIDERFKQLIIPKVAFTVNYNRSTVEYTAEQLTYIKNYPTKLNSKIKWNVTAIYEDMTTGPVRANKIMSDNNHLFFGWKCSAGIEGINVFADGSVRAGICNAQMLGTIHNFKLLDEYLTCRRPTCTCPGDIDLTKYDPKRIVKT